MSLTKQTIGLCMIVRNEADVIERCLGSVTPLIDTWTICDTGSTDGTPERVATALEGVPGQFHHRRWVDFGHNRSELMDLSRGTADYLLLIDADMTIDRRGTLPQLSADAYQLHHAGPIDYVIPRLVRGDLPWHYVGATHEYLASDDERTYVKLEQLLIRHHGDGGSRADKFERDEALLRRELQRNPDDVRATFYLAQTLRDIGRTAEAIEAYERRVALGGWDQEVFFAAYQAALLGAKDEPERAVERLLGAHELRPTRAEPLCEAATICRSLGRWEEAYDFASRAVATPYPADDLFTIRDVYEWRALMELSAAAWWCGHHEEALEASERLLAIPSLPAEAARVAEGNRQVSLDSLGRSAPPIRPVNRMRLGALLDLELGEIRIDVEPSWPAFNPSIAADGEGGFRMIVRTANYALLDGRYHILDDSESVRTINYLAQLDGSLTMQSLHPLEDATTASTWAASPILGYEDCRLILLGDRWIALATVRDRNPEVRAEVALLELEGIAKISRVTTLRGPDPGRNEKNWMPFVRQGDLLVVYSCGPTEVRALKPGNEDSVVLSTKPVPDLASSLGGGSQGLRIPEGWLFVVHEVHPLGTRRLYSHRFMLLDDDLTLSGITPAFSFTGAEVEYCCGLAAQGSNLVCSFGVGDRDAALALVDRDEVLALLENPLTL